MTYGQIRYELTKAMPGVDLALLDGWLYDRYQAILDALSWQRREVESILQSTAKYNAGTVAVTNGSTGVTGTGTTWTTGMTGRRFRVAGRYEYYEFTRTGNTTGTLDRAYEGGTNAAAGYTIFQNVYLLPSDVVTVKDLRAIATPGLLTRVSLAHLNEISPSRETFGDPVYWALFMDDASDPPRAQIELYPIPEYSRGYPLVYVADVTPPSTTSASILPWMRPAALKYGAKADERALAGDFDGAQWYENRFKEALAEMMGVETRRRGATPLRVADWMTRHQTRRWNR
jgi:hypothetical protein